MEGRIHNPRNADMHVCLLPSFDVDFMSCFFLDREERLAPYICGAALAGDWGVGAWKEGRLSMAL